MHEGMHLNSRWPLWVHSHFHCKGWRVEDACMYIWRQFRIEHLAQQLRHLHLVPEGTWKTPGDGSFTCVDNLDWVLINSFSPTKPQSMWSFGEWIEVCVFLPLKWVNEWMKTCNKAFEWSLSLESSPKHFLIDVCASYSTYTRLSLPQEYFVFAMPNV